MKTSILRLLPGDDLKKKIAQYCLDHQIQAGVVLSSVGSLQQLRLRLANAQTVLEKKERFEILSLNGTLSGGGLHLHMTVADSQGHVLGGHLVDGNLIYTTCELVVGEMADVSFTREVDSRTGFQELVISKK